MITIFTLLTVTACGPFALNISGTTKDAVLTYLGFILFDDIMPTTMILIGITMSFCGAVTIIYINVKSSEAKKTADAKAKSDKKTK